VTYIVIAFFFGLAGGVIGRIKGSSFFLWFLVSACVPFVGLLAAIAYRVESDEPRRECPGCGRVVKLHDALCTRCGTELEYTDEVTVLPPESAVAR
jgi:RNA polymerase subunit RPABC4/transcription elongation factor Spt4